MNKTDMLNMATLAEQSEQTRLSVEALHSNIKSVHEESAQTITTLLAGMADIEKRLARQLHELTGQTAALKQSTDQIAPRAFEGGKEAVTTQARAAFKEAGAALAAANEEAIAPTRAALAKGLAAQDASRAMLETAAQRLSGKALTMMFGVTLAALLTMAAGGYGFVMWRRSALDDLKREADAQELRLANLKTIVADMEKKGAELDAKGVRFQTSQCGAEGKSKGRLCVAIDPAGGEYVSPSGVKYRVPLGY